MNQTVPLTVLAQMDGLTRQLAKAQYDEQRIAESLKRHFSRFEPDTEDAKASIQRVKLEQQHQH